MLAADDYPRLPLSCFAKIRICSELVCIYINSYYRITDPFSYLKARMQNPADPFIR